MSKKRSKIVCHFVLHVSQVLFETSKWFFNSQKTSKVLYKTLVIFLSLLVILFIYFIFEFEYYFHVVRFHDGNDEIPNGKPKVIEKQNNWKIFIYMYWVYSYFNCVNVKKEHCIFNISNIITFHISNFFFCLCFNSYLDSNCTTICWKQ